MTFKAALGGLCAALACGTAQSQVRIMEVDSDTTGTDVLEFIELYDGGVGNTSLTGLVVVLFNGSAANNASYLAVDLDGKSTNAQGYYLLGNAGVVPTPGSTFASNTLQNGADAVALYTANGTDFPNGTAATQTNLVDAVAYGTDDPTDADLLTALGLSVQADEGASTPAQTQSVGRLCYPNGSFGTLTTPTPGASNGTCVPDDDGDGVPNKTDNCPTIANPGQQDCNQNGVGDVCDIFKGASFDCNLNGIPDECPSELDCNFNGVPDSCDIANATSTDVNVNGVPDECENPIAMVINEILANGNAGDANNDSVVNLTNDEFIEIVNNTGAQVDMSGWTISDLTGTRHTFASGTLVASNCSIVVFGNGSPTGQFGGGLIQTSSSGDLGLNNGAETIDLRDAFGLLVTRVSYTAALGGATASMTRSPDITGALPFVTHTTVNAGVNFSPGRTAALTLFGGCTTLPDNDNDGIPNVSDNCPSVANSNQADCDNDGIGNACDTDPDANGNGVPDVCEIAPPPGLRLNEIRIDQTGTDNDEYVELKGTPGTSLNNIALIVLGDTNEGGSGSIEAIVSLNGKTIPADGHFLMAEGTYSLPGPANDVPNVTYLNNELNFENDDNLTFILVGNSTGSLNQDLDTNNDGVLDSAAWLSVIDAVGLIKVPNPPTGTRYSYAQVLGGVDVGPDGIFVPGQVYRCETGGIWTIGRFNPFDALGGTDTAGKLNLACPSNCPADIAPTGGDDVVNVQDLLAVIAAWGNCPVPPAGCPADIAPVGGDNAVNVQDLLAVIAAWGPCAP